MNISPFTVVKYLQATLKMMLGKQSPEASFDISENGLWQAIFVSWIISGHCINYSYADDWMEFFPFILIDGPCVATFICNSGLLFFITH